MIPRYTHPEMGRIWSDQRRYETWLLVETAAAEAMAAAGIIPPDAARDIRAAVRTRRAAASQALDAYDGATGDRLAEAITFLRALKESDQAYAEARASALERYAGRIREARGYL